MLTIKHLLDLAALIFFACCLGGAVWFCGFRNAGRDPWPTDTWSRQQDAGTGPMEGVVIEPEVSLDAKVRDTLARADSMLAIK